LRQFQIGRRNIHEPIRLLTMAWSRFYCDLEAHVCGPDATILDVMARMDKVTPYLFQVVIDKDRRVLGTVTDGDVRRALLRGVSIESPVTSSMHVEPIIGLDGDRADNENKIRQMGLLRTTNIFMPLVDGHRQLTKILVLEHAEADQACALVMAGGKGQRLGPRTRTVPKPLIDVAGRPMLDHVLDQVEAAGITRIFVSVNHMADQIEDFVGRRKNQGSIEVVTEGEALGTAGAIGLLPDLHNGPLIVMNGDVLSDVNLQGMLDFHERHDFDATVGAAHYEYEVPFGVIRHDQSGAFEGVTEKPRHRYYVSAGINVLSPSIRALVPRGQRFDMPELLNSGRGAGLKVSLYPIHEYWTDLGRPADLDAARAPIQRVKRSTT
jgi:dTDP-glucose pyrophosphorylase